MSESEEKAVTELFDQIPSYDTALGCVDCSRLFRSGPECPYCGSHSIENIGALLSGLKGDA